MIVDLSEITDPEIHEFVAYWSSVKGEAFAPTWKQFNLPKLNPKLVPYANEPGIFPNTEVPKAGKSTYASCKKNGPLRRGTPSTGRNTANA